MSAARWLGDCGDVIAADPYGMRARLLDYLLDYAIRASIAMFGECVRAATRPVRIHRQLRPFVLDHPRSSVWWCVLMRPDVVWFSLASGVLAAAITAVLIVVGEDRI